MQTESGSRLTLPISLKTVRRRISADKPTLVFPEVCRML